MVNHGHAYTIEVPTRHLINYVDADPRIAHSLVILCYV